MPRMSRKAAPANADQQLPCSALGWALSLPAWCRRHCLVPTGLETASGQSGRAATTRRTGRSGTKVHGVSVSLDSRKYSAI